MNYFKGESMKVLLVDDYVQVAQLCGEYLSDIGHEVVIAHNVQTALENFDESFDVIITDFSMPDGTGLDLIESISKDSKVKKILISGEMSSLLISEKSRFDVCLAKPFTFDELILNMNSLFSC